MYKQFRIISSETLGEELDEVLKKQGIAEYYLMDDIKSMWGENVKHMNTHTWPGIDQVRIVVVKTEEAPELIEVFRDLKGKIKDTIKLRVIVTTINEII